MRAVTIAIVGIGAFCAAQLVPYGRAHTNPPVEQEPQWESDATRTLFYRACRDCHSNETEWPWYSFVAPASWLVQHDVDEGRSHFNASEWGRAKQHGDEAAEMVRETKMPPWFYLPLHPHAGLTPVERDQFVAGLEATFGSSEEEPEPGDHEH